MFRRCCASILAAFLGASVAVSAQNYGREAKAKKTAPEIPFETVRDFFKMPEGVYMGEGIGVATNAKGHVYVYTRSGETRLFEFDQTGKFVKDFAPGSYAWGFAHAVRVDKDENVWAVDEGSNVIQKFSPDGKLLMVLGKRPDPLFQIGHMPGGGQYSGSNRPYTFHRPTDIAFDPQGNLFVSDGYGDSRVVKYDKNGKFVGTYGKGRGTGDAQFSTPHSIAVDLNGLVYVADRGNSRIHVLNNDLSFKTMYDHVGAPWALCTSQGPHQYLFSSNSFPSGSNFDDAPTTGEVYKMELDGKVVGRFGKAGHAIGEFSAIHQMDCRNPNEVYTAEITAWRVQKVLLKPQGTQTTSGGQ